MKRKQIGLIISIAIIGIIAVASTFAFKHNEKEKAYNTLLTKADKNMEEHNFKDAKSLYEESLVIKDNKEISHKIDLIKNIEDSLEKLNIIEPLVQENKFDEATEVLNKINSPSEYISSEIKTKTEKISKLKEDFLEKQRLAKEAEKKRIADEKRQSEEKRKVEEKRVAEEAKKKAEEKKQQQNTNKNNSQSKPDLPDKKYNIRTKILFDAQSPVYITYNQTVNIVAKDYFRKNPKVNVRDPIFYLSAIEGSFIVDVELNGKILEYEINPTQGEIVGIQEVNELPRWSN